MGQIIITDAIQRPVFVEPGTVLGYHPPEFKFIIHPTFSVFFLIFLRQHNT